MSRILPGLKRLRRKWILVGFDLLRLLGRWTIRFGPPAGTYSILENPGTFTMVLDRQASIPATPGSLRDISKLEQDKQQPFPIFWAHLPNARLVGVNLAVLNDEKKVMIENLYGAMQYRTDPAYNYRSLPPAVRLNGNWTSLIGRWCHSGRSTYFHWMFDALPRLGLLHQFPSDCGILIPDPLFKAQRESLEILGLVDRCRPTTEHHLLVDNYYYSSFTARQGCDDFYAARFLRDRFLDAAIPVPTVTDKIYLSRRGAARAPFQEEEMIDFLEGEGWTIILPEDYSFRQQIGIFRRARAVCSIHGAALTNVVWCEKGCQVLELCADNFLNGCYEGVALCSGLEHRFAVFPADSHFRISVDMEKFKSAIRALG